MEKERLKKRKRAIFRSSVGILTFLLILFISMPAYAQATGKTNVDSTTQNEIKGNSADDDKTFDLNISSNAGSTNLEATLKILLILTAISLAPSILIMVTSFTRIIVVFHFIRTALGTQTTPPNQVLVGLALFITVAIMSPIMVQVNDNAVQPYMNGQ